MKKIIALIVALGVVGAAAFVFLMPEPAPPEQMRLQATLAGTDTDVSDKVTWFVERDGSWLGPDIALVSEAVPGEYEAQFDVLGEEQAVAKLSLGDDEGGTLAATLDATLIEVELPPEARSGPVSFRFASDRVLGSHGVFVDDAGVVRTLVSTSLKALELEIDGQTLPITANFASGGVERLKLQDGAVVPAL
ncbi:MAG: hypothetical protein AAFN94_05270 [Pseudomonadota bacterium]